MGQYWKAVLEKSDDLMVVDPMEYNVGWKLTEHSFYGNIAVLRVIDELRSSKARVWWVGDYYGDYDSEGDNEFRADILEAAWADGATSLKGAPATSQIQELSGYLVNHTKKEYVDMRKYFLSNEFSFGEEKGWCLEPLPLLTAVSNGLGGGDFHKGGDDYESVGAWAGDEVSFSMERPDYAERTARFLEKGYRRVAEAV